MIDANGNWIEEKDYSVYPEEKWCDYDYMAVWIRSKGYEPKTSMQNLIDNVLDYYESMCKITEKRYFEVKDTREYPDNLMVNIPDVELYVESSSGLEYFDF